MLTISPTFSPSCSVSPFIVITESSVILRLCVVELRASSLVLSWALGESLCSFHDESDREAVESCDSVSNDSELALLLLCLTMNASDLPGVVEVDVLLAFGVWAPPLSVEVRRDTPSLPGVVLFILS